MSSKITTGVTFARATNAIGTIGIIGSLVAVLLELQQNYKVMEESNNLARMEASDRSFINSLEVRREIIDNIDIWVKGSAGETLTEKEEEVFFNLCANQVFALASAWEQDFYSANQEKMQVRLDIAKSQGDSACYDRPMFKQRLESRGEIFAPLVEAINLGAIGGVQN